MAVALFLAVAVAQTLDPGAPPPDVAQASGPRGTSGEQRYDGIGYAGVEAGGDPGGVTIASAVLAPGGFAEITSRDTGHTIIALVAGRSAGSGTIADLSPAAAQALGAKGGTIAVRIRPVLPSAQEQGALRSGQAVPSRLDAPPALLVALRKRLPGSGVPVTSRRQPLAPPRVTADDDRPAARQSAHAVSRPGAAYAPPGDARTQSARALRQPASPAPPTSEASSGGSGWYVQVATLSALDRAQALASSLGGGRIVSTGNLHRVQIGPYVSNAAAERARDGIARRGYGGARILRADK